jgi:hypothetical protein
MAQVLESGSTKGVQLDNADIDSLSVPNIRNVGNAIPSFSTAITNSHLHVGIGQILLGLESKGAGRVKIC